MPFFTDIQTKKFNNVNLYTIIMNHDVALITADGHAVFRYGTGAL